MPEGHHLHRLAIDQSKLFARQKLAISSPQGRFADEAKNIDGHALKSIEAVGKHLFYYFAKAPALHIHLGLYGKYRQYKNPPPEPRGAVRVRMTGKTHTVDLNGPNQCNLMDPAKIEEARARLGPDPLDPKAEPAKAWARIHKTRTPIGMLLMDQAILAGIGNIYRTELLFLSQIHPKQPGNTITRKQFNRLWKDAVALMRIGMKYDKIVTVDLKQLKKPVAKLRSGERFNIFKMPKCPDCGTAIQRLIMGGRKVFVCPNCQTLDESAIESK